MVSSVIVSILETQFSLCNTSWCNTMALSEKCYLDEGNVSYSPSDIIGRGGFGVVYRGFIDVKHFEDQSVAIKKINLSCYDEKARDREPMVNLRHENFINIVKVLTDNEYRYLVMEMCVGTLAQVIDGSYKGPTLPSDVLVLRDIANGLYYIHTEKLVHRNIKPENILISKVGRMKISDLNYADSMTSGSCCWMAQELLAMLMIARTFGTENSKNIKFKITPSCDIFSAGCVFFVFLTRGIGGVHPFGDDNLERLSNILKGDPVNIEKLDFNHYARATIDKMVARSHRDRNSLPDVLKMLEKEESTELDHSELENQSNSLPRDASISTIEKDSNEELFAMNEELDPLENVEVKLEDSELEGDRGACSLQNAVHSESNEESSAETSATRQPIIEENDCCVKVEPVVTENSSCTTTNQELAPLNLVRPSTAPDKVSFKRFPFASSLTKRIQFHPVHSNLLSCDSSKGVLTFQQHSGDSFIHCDSPEIEDPKYNRSKLSLKWNIDGTKLATAYDDGLIVVWEYPSCKIIFEEKMPFKYPRVEWNQCNPNVFATYKWKTQTVCFVWLSDKSHSHTREFRSPIMTVEWVSQDRIVIAYYNGSLHLYYADSTQFYILMEFRNPASTVRNMSWSQKHQLLATGSYKGVFLMWKMNSCTPAFNPFYTFSPCESLAWQPKVTEEGRESSYPTLACGLENGTIEIWSPLINEDYCITRLHLKRSEDKVTMNLFSPDGNYLAAFSFHQGLYIWLTKNWKIIKKTSVKCREASWNALGNKLAIVTNQSDKKIPECQLELLELQVDHTSVETALQIETIVK